MGPRAGLDFGGVWRMTRFAPLRFEVCFLGCRGKVSGDTTRGWKLLDHLSDLSSNLIFVVPCIMLNSEIIPTRCNNCVYSSQWLYSTCFG